MNAANRAPLLRLHQASKRYHRHHAVRDVDLTLHQSEAIALTGPNGSGKSTLLRLIGGLLPLTAGLREQLSDTPLTIGYVPDRFPKLKFGSREYLAHMGAIQGMPRSQLHSRIEELHALFRLQPDLLHQDLRYYSKGMLQKVNVMQALLTTPDILLLDEPLSGLDAGTQLELLTALQQLQRQGVAIVAVTHEPAFAEQLADRIVTMDQGRLVRSIQGRTAATLSDSRELGAPRMRISCQAAPELLRRLSHASGGVVACEMDEPSALGTPCTAHFVLQHGYSDAFLLGALNVGVSILAVQQDDSPRDFENTAADSGYAMASTGTMKPMERE
ncbi:ABC-type multidrug transport system ATPase subunit [Paenibacillus phyllosphaerae]|uniref:ABC-type multidrug transport system ATPase subunit n=1 Tax=Paenibacillus phyllosphaerae TaxID=274593 RepID=A0A7W5B4Q5_9BACL|nr:ABC transporter ATP-binding protein [Paenibacillus phyllosphaerae]MBB3114367.1 ABC-type multidrug transport system ATPase subunit [Paenibacillus phyllosphaerae]